MRSGILLALWFLGLAAAGFAQQKPADEPAATSTVSGHVYCADTNAPARMATVVLQPAGSIEGWRPGEENHVSYHADAVQTLLDGSFSIAHVAPGAYYVVASEPGYLSPLSSFFAPVSDKPAAEDGAAKRIPKSVPRITVQGGLPVAVNVTLERGAAVSGTVLYDDGSPAIGLRVTPLVHWKDQWIPMPSNPVGNFSYSASTDDQGNYRIGGLPAREYLLEVELNLSAFTYSVSGQGGSGMSTSGVYSLAIYSGGKTRSKDAVPFSIASGDERHGEDIQIPISKLHSVRGSVIAAHDGHVLNGGNLSLLYADDKSVAGNANISEDDDGFTFSFVPEGDYILRVYIASDNEYQEIPNPPHSIPPARIEHHNLRIYGAADRSLHVDGELTGVVIAVPDLPEQKIQPKP